AWSVDQATPVTVAAGTVTTGIDAQLQKPPSGPGKIHGTVTSVQTGKPVAGVKVCVVEPVNSPQPVCEKTDQSGEYAVTNLVAGKWLITFKTQETGQNLLSLAYPNKEIWETPTPVTVSPGGQQTVNVALKTGGV